MDQLVAQGKFNWSLHYCTKSFIRKDDIREMVEEDGPLKAPKGEKLHMRGNYRDESECKLSHFIIFVAV